MSSVKAFCLIHNTYFYLIVCYHILIIYLYSYSLVTSLSVYGKAQTDFVLYRHGRDGICVTKKSMSSVSEERGEREREMTPILLAFWCSKASKSPAQPSQAKRKQQKNRITRIAYTKFGSYMCFVLFVAWGYFGQDAG